MHVIRARYGADSPRQVADSVRYISHREEGLPAGRTRELYGIGARYRELRGDERAIVSRLVVDAEGLRRPVYYRLRLTLNDDLARRVVDLSRLSSSTSERVMRDAVDKTLRGVARSMQGVYVIHSHGGHGRPWGHPHAHVYLSPRRTHGAAVKRLGPDWLSELRHRWGQEIDRAVERYERRLRAPERRRLPLERTRAIDRGQRLPTGPLRWAGTARSIATGQLNSERLAQRVVWRAAAAAVPAPLRTVARLLERLLPPR